jgi:hypothetical protein
LAFSAPRTIECRFNPYLAHDTPNRLQDDR